MIAERRAARRDDLLSALDRRRGGGRPLVARGVGGDGRAADLRRARDHAEPARQRHVPPARSIPTSSPCCAASPTASPTRSRRCCATTRRSCSRRGSRPRISRSAGVPVAADQLVMLNLTAANHDPARFDDARAVRRAPAATCGTCRSATACTSASARASPASRPRSRSARCSTATRSIEEVGESDWTTYTPLRGRQRLDLACRRLTDQRCDEADADGVAARDGAGQERHRLVDLVEREDLAEQRLGGVAAAVEDRRSPAPSTARSSRRRRRRSGP